MSAFNNSSLLPDVEAGFYVPPGQRLRVCRDCRLMVGDLKTQVRGGAPVFGMGQPSLLTWFKLESPRGEPEWGGAVN